MKKLIAVIVLSLVSISTTFAGENPKLWKEINRKLKINVSQLDLSKSKKNSVIVKFRIVNSEVEILEAEGSEELRGLIIEKLENMDIKASTAAHEVYQYKFNFRAE